MGADHAKEAALESECSQNRKCREISNPEADLQLIAPLANRELFKSRFAKARKLNDFGFSGERFKSTEPFFLKQTLREHWIRSEHNSLSFAGNRC